MMLLGQAAAGEIEIETPNGGWRNSAQEKMKFTQEVHYPASSVNMQKDQSKFAMIKGKIERTKKDQNPEPYRLIINGVPMPLLSNPDGSFSRPYLFGSGSNNVEIRSPDNTVRKRVQFYENNASAMQARLSVILSWDTDQTDLDLHVLSPDGKHCWYGDRIMENGGALDVDVTTGYGPEIYSTPTPLKGTYLVYVNYYGSGPRSDLTTANVTVVTNQNTQDEKVETVTVPMRKAGELTQVFSFVLQ